VALKQLVDGERAGAVGCDGEVHGLMITRGATLTGFLKHERASNGETKETKAGETARPAGQSSTQRRH
jgi:hypothetical protein